MLLDDMREELVRRLTDIFRNNISMIILYGLVARNEVTDESDIDIAIILKNQISHETKQQFFRWVADLNMRYDRVFSIVDIQEDNVEKWGSVLPFYQNVRKEGTILWKIA